MSFLLDSDVCSFHLRQRVSLTSRIIQYSGRLAISAIALGELYAWTHRAPDPQIRLQTLGRLLNDLDVLDFDSKCAKIFGELKWRLQQSGQMAPAADLMIAAVAIAHDLTLVTHNTKDYQHIPDLRLVDWIDE